MGAEASTEPASQKELSKFNGSVADFQTKEAKL